MIRSIISPNRTVQNRQKTFARSRRLFSFAALLSLLISTASYSDIARWVIQDDDTQILLVGTIHVLRPGTLWLDNGLRQDISQADSLTLELSPSEQSPEIMVPLLLTHSRLPKGETLDAQLDPDLYQKTAQLLSQVGLKSVQIQQMRPWMASVTAALASFSQKGYNPEAGVEAQLIALASQQNIPVNGLETAAQQITRFSGLDRQTEIDFLRSTVEQLPQAGPLMAQMTNLWLAGDIDNLDRLLRQDFQNNPILEQRLLSERNKNWQAPVAALLQKPGLHVVAVGAAHLSGEDSLIALLKAAGYMVTRIDRP